jgi:hypothetical protein
VVLRRSGGLVGRKRRFSRRSADGVGLEFRDPLGQAGRLEGWQLGLGTEGARLQATGVVDDCLGDDEVRLWICTVHKEGVCGGCRRSE